MRDLITTGISPGDQVEAVKLPAPTISATLSAGEQETAVKTILGDMELERFIKKSFVSPFVLNISSVSDLPDGGHIQQLDLWFVAHGTLQDIENKELFESLAVPAKSKANGLVEEARTLTTEELTKRNLQTIKQPDGLELSYGVLRTNILDKIYVTGITHSSGERRDDGLTMAFQLDSHLKDDPDLPSRWYPLNENDDGDVTLGDPSPFEVAAAYAQATPLLFAEEAILVEIHLVFAEPHGWFEGRNLLRSKLPLLVQDGVRSFRRKLAQ